MDHHRRRIAIDRADSKGRKVVVPASIERDRQQWRRRFHGAARARLVDLVRLTLLAPPVLLASGFGCAADTQSPAAAPRQQREPSTGEEIAPAPLPTDVNGAAAAVAETPAPADVEGLATRVVPKEVPLPAVRGGRSANFTFDGKRRGWFARLPDGRNKLLTPTYGRGRIYVGGGFTSQSFYGLDAETGRMEWATMAEDGGPTSAIIEDDKVIFNTESCTLFAVDAETGRILWKRWLGDPLMSQAAAANGRVFSGHIRDEGGYGFTAMNLANGAVLWSRRIRADVMNAPVLDDDGVFFTTMNGDVWNLDQATGAVRWQKRLGASSAPWLEGDTVHVAIRVAATEDGRQTRREKSIVLAKADGEIRREFAAVDAPFVPLRADAGGVEAGWAYEGSRPTLVEGRAYQTIGNEVQCRRADTGELLWRRRYTDSARSRPASSPAVAQSQIVFGTEDGVLYGLDIDSGLTTFAYSVGEPIRAQPTVANGWVYAATTRGGVIGLEVADASVGGWHMWGGNAKHNGPVAAADVAIDRAHRLHPEENRPGEGSLRLGEDPRTDEAAGFPLEHTEVEARISGPVTHVTVRQRFRNPFDRPVEAVYLFPLPDEAAVDAMELHAGTRTVRGQIERREQARRNYREARERGVLASLLEQERPNLFRQSVANIRPGDAIEVTLQYTQALAFEDGSYRFGFPMVTGARYMPGGGAEDRDGASGASPAAAAADHGRGTARVALTSGAARPDRVDLTIEANLGTELMAIDSPTHDLDITRPDARRARVTLADSAVPNRDLEVRFHVAGDAPTVSVVPTPPSAGGPGYFSMQIHPRLAVPDAEVTARELVFLIDASSSMAGLPIELAKAAVLRALDGLRPTDRFRILSFADDTAAFSDEALVASAQSITRAKRFVRGVHAFGATEMVRGIERALRDPDESSHMRIVMLLTDGYIGNETEIFAAVNEHLGRSRIFAFGVGGAVNRYLLSRISEVGRGDMQVVTLSESPEQAADTFHDRIARPFLTDLQIDWGGLAVTEVYPRRLPDLFADRPVRIAAQYARGGRATVTVRGRVAGRAFAQAVEVELPRNEASARPELGSLWARTRIRDLMTAMALRPNEQLREEVTELGLRHHLLTQWTSFIAVDEGYRVDDPGQSASMPSALPAGVEYRAGARAMRPRASMGSLGAIGFGGGGGTGYGAAAHGAVGESYGLGGLGVRGIGRGGGGYGNGTIGVGAARPVELPEVLSATPAAEVAAERREVHPRASAAANDEDADDTRRSDAPTMARAHAALRVGLRRVFQNELRANPLLSGGLIIVVTIDASGRVVQAAAINDTVGSPTLTARLVAAARAVPFPSGGAVRELRIPLTFAEVDGN